MWRMAGAEPAANRYCGPLPGLMDSELPWHYHFAMTCRLRSMQSRGRNRSTLCLIDHLETFGRFFAIDHGPVAARLRPSQKGGQNREAGEHTRRANGVNARPRAQNASQRKSFSPGRAEPDLLVSARESA
jgi:hypothetical protein